MITPNANPNDRSLQPNALTHLAGLAEREPLVVYVENPLACGRVHLEQRTQVDVQVTDRLVSCRRRGAKVGDYAAPSLYTRVVCSTNDSIVPAMLSLSKMQSASLQRSTSAIHSSFLFMQHQVIQQEVIANAGIYAAPSHWSLPVMSSLSKMQSVSLQWSMSATVYPSLTTSAIGDDTLYAAPSH
jgi:hypothetical protein